MIVHRSYAGNPDGLGKEASPYPITAYTGTPVYYAVSTLSMAVSAFHGYRRNEGGDHPIAWALAWGFLGGLFPVIVPVIAVAQGYGEPEPR